jgi:hypothetical protein
VQIGASLRSIIGTPDNLVKPFYSKRRGYSVAAEKETSARLLETTRRLLEEEWPATIYPSLPWHDAEAMRAQFPDGTKTLYGVNLDAFLVSGEPPRWDKTTASCWVADDPKAAWIQKIVPTIGDEVAPMKNDSWQSDDDVDKRIGESRGSLITSHREGTWWTYRIIQSLNNGTPVATDWREASIIGSSWGILPSAIESLYGRDIENLAWNQLDEYMQHIPSRDEAGKALKTIIGSDSSKRKASK